ncbi:LysR family transcriptional regulator [Paraburkholderia sp. BL23I1N1]|uniref:LysR family transcriptional regulator n=1 Tax=Paraburkholderia sp. BL23I1N1 TaxID=1938802 RepID=UPI000E707193|nr:LysR family transcriptional regulator [Paraburkholderia sp. BL23I1N1]RKE37486.1 LysR family transcriptional regulator [Paraburkholderia sp. BL23I1N1]
MQSDKTISRGVLDDLSAFAAVARMRSFSRAAAELNVSNSMLSYTIKRLESRLGYPLLRRTSRSVAPTAEGQALLLTLEPALDAIDGALGDLSRIRDRISGTLRITATRQGYEAVIRPVLTDFCTTYPDATVEVIIDYAFRDLVSGRFDAGVRLGEKLEQDMVALPVGPALRMAVVASPEYLSRHSAPSTPDDLQHHRCINYRMETAGSLYSWEFESDGRKLKMALSGPLTFNEPDLMIGAAIDGLGVAYVLEHEAAPHIGTGRLARVLEDWCPPFAGFFLYYPSRKQVSPVLAALLKRLRAR